MSDINFKLDLAIDDFKKAAQQATQATKELSKDFQKNTGNMSQSWNVFAGSISADVFKKALNAVVGIFGTAISEAANAEESVNNLNIALRQSGNYSKQTSQELQDFASELQKITIYSDDTVMGVISTLEALTDLDKDGLKATTKTVIDFASKYGKSTEEASTMVARALEGNTVAFNKMGIKIKEGSTQSERLKNVMDALSGSAGAAEAKVNTFSGEMAKLKNQVGEAYEKLGGFITNSDVVRGSIELAAKSFVGFVGVIENVGNFVSKNSDYFIALGIGIAAAVTPIALITGAIQAVTIATAAWNAVLALNPVYWVALGVAGLIAGIVLLIRKWDEVKLATLNFAKTTLEALLPLQGALNKLFGLDVSVLNSGLDSINKKIKETKDILAKKNESVIDSKSTEEAKKEADEQARIAKNKAEMRAATERKSQAELAQIRKDAASQEANEQLALQNSLASENSKYLDEKRLREINALTVSQQEKDAIIIADIEKRNAERIAELEAVQFQESEKLRIQTEAELAKAKMTEDTAARNKAVEEANAKAKIAQINLSNKQQLDMLKLRHSNENELENKRVETQKQIDANKIANQRDTFSTIATLSQSNNKVLASIGKAAAMTQIAIDTPVAIGKALAAFPPPFNFVAAGLVGTAMAVQAAKVAGLNFETGGIVPGNSFTGDNVSANVNSGEMILNRQQQAQLFAQANGESSSSGSVLSAINNLADRIANMEIKLYTSDSNIALATSRGVMDGVILGSSR